MSLLFLFRLAPEEASTLAGRVDALTLFLLGVTIFFSLLIAVCIVVFSIRFRRRSEDEMPKPIKGSLLLEIIWTVVPLVLTMIMFFWGARVYFAGARPPSNAMQINVVGKQWMWKLQHMDGRREINELHVPVGAPVKLIMTSEDVIHSFFIPAFRVKRDVVPGGYSTEWFQATKTGSYHFFCSQYCGAAHSAMIGRVIVMEPAEYRRWLKASAQQEPPAVAGKKWFERLNCAICHQPDEKGRGPSLIGLFGKPVKMRDGETLRMDENAIRESILKPTAHVVAGYEPIMPSYEGQITEEGIMQLIAYIRSLEPKEARK